MSVFPDMEQLLRNFYIEYLYDDPYSDGCCKGQEIMHVL